MFAEEKTYITLLTQQQCKMNSGVRGIIEVIKAISPFMYGIIFLSCETNVQVEIAILSYKITEN